MRVTRFQKNPKVYSCNVYYIRGDWNAISDVNTLIDTGTDDHVLSELQRFSSTGVGKRKVEQVILTHEHFDHTGGLKHVIAEYSPTVYAYSKIPGVDVKVRDTMKIKVGDRICEIIHTPGHSNDSICIYCPEEQVLFSGDMLLNIRSPESAYTRSYLQSLERISRLRIKTIYSGHDDPITENISEMLRYSLKNVKSARIID